MRVTLIALVVLLAACAERAPSVIMHGQSLQTVSNDQLCRTYQWRGPYTTGDGATVRAEVTRRGIDCGIPGSEKQHQAHAIVSPPPNLALIGLR